MNKADEEYVKRLTPPERLCLAFARYAEQKMGNKRAVMNFLEYFRKVDRFIEEHPGIDAEDLVFKNFVEESKPWSEQQWREIKNQILADPLAAHLNSKLLISDKEYVQGLTPEQQYVLILAGYAEDTSDRKGTVAKWLEYFRKVDKFIEERPSIGIEDLAFKNFVQENKPKRNEEQWREIEREMIEMMGAQKTQAQQEEAPLPKSKATQAKRNTQHHPQLPVSQNQPKQNIATVSQSQERIPFTKHPGFRLTVVLVCIVVVVCLVQQKKAENQTRKESEARRMRTLIDQGYRIQPDGSFRMATQEQKIQQGDGGHP